MPYLKITQKGWDGYTGVLGDVPFEDGVSLENVSTADSKRLASIIQMEERDSGKDPSVSQELIDTRHMTLGEHEGFVRQKSVDNASVDETKAFTAEPSKPSDSDKSYSYTMEDLEAVADKGGIEGLREFASEYDVRGGSIRAIINSLMAVKQENQ